MIRLARLYLCAMRTSIGVGKLFDEHGRLSITDLVDGHFLTAEQQLGHLLPTLDANEVLISLPGAGRWNNGPINSAVVNIASMLKSSERKTVLYAEEVQNIEHDTQSQYELKQCTRGAECVARLHAAYKAASYNALKFGRSMTLGLPDGGIRFSDITSQHEALKAAFGPPSEE